MPYTRPYPGGFQDFPNTTTPINASTLNTMDVGIKTSNDQFQTVTTAQRATLTPSVGQAVWDSDLKQLMVFMNASGGNAWQPVGNAIVCTSTTRPSTPFEGQVIRETDTNREFTYSGAAWVQTNQWSTTSGVTGVNNLIVPPMCSLSRTTAQSINSGSDTVIAYDSAVFDTDGMATTGASAKITIQTSGVYLVTFGVSWANYTSTTTRVAFVNKNAGSSNRIIFLSVTPTTGEVIYFGSALVSLVATDTLTAYAYHERGSAVNINPAGGLPASVFSAVWVGRTS